MRVAAVQFEPRLGERERNLARLLELLEEAFAAGAELAVAPEMATSGYCFLDRAEALPCAETLPGPSSEAVARLCARRGGVAVFGLPEVERETGLLFNAVAVVGPEGLLGRYRKLHSFVSEPRWAMDGDLGPLVVATPAGRIGVLDCADVMHVEVCRALQLGGAECIAFPTDWCSDPAPSAVWWARAWELGLPLVAADRVGRERGVAFAGGSAVFDADGRLLGCLDQGEGTVVAEVGPPRPRPRTLPPPPRLVLDLARSSHLYDPSAFFNLYGREQLPPGGRLRVAALPLRGRWTDVAAALRDVDAELVVLPADALWPEGPSSDGVEEKVLDLCRARGSWLAAGRLGPDGEEILALFGPQGEVVRRALGRTFSGTPVATALPGARVALCSGTELLWPETSRLAAVDGADILLVLDDGDVPAPQGFPGSALALGGVSAPPNPWHYWIPRVRAITDDLCVAYACAQRPCGFFQAESGAGDAGDLGAAGVLDTRAGAEGDPQVRRKPFLQRRRPEHYRALWRAGTARDGQGAGGRPVGEG